MGDSDNICPINEIKDVSLLSEDRSNILQESNIQIDSNINSDPSIKTYKIIVLESIITENQRLQTALKEHLNVFQSVTYEIVTESELMSESYFETQNDENCVYILKDFDSKLFLKLAAHNRIIGPPCAVYLSELSLSIYHYSPKHVYCNILDKAIITFSGFSNNDKNELYRLVKLARYMGAIVKRRMDDTITHVVFTNVLGNLYEDAIGLGLPVMCVDWIVKSWNHREDYEFCATDESFVENFKMKPLQGLKIAFHGFNAIDFEKIENYSKLYGAELFEVTYPKLDIIVVDEIAVHDLSINPPPGAVLLESNWYWKSIENLVKFPFNNYIISTDPKPALPEYYRIPRVSSHANNPSKRSRASIAGIKLKRKSRDQTSEQSRQIDTLHQNIQELIYTETNYIRILNVLNQKFYQRLLNENPKTALIPIHMTKKIFKNIPDILDVHVKILNDLSLIDKNWDTSPYMVKVFEKYTQLLSRAYHGFISCYELNISYIEQYSGESPRFYAFLKGCLADKECDRQTLTELLIRPVQRLPSIILILKQILKHTAKESESYPIVEQDVYCLGNILNKINSDKRRTNEQIEMHEVFNDIDKCPNDLLSSNRHIIMRVEVMEISLNKNIRPKNITLFVMTDMIEVVKKIARNILNHAGSKLIHSPSVISLGRAKSFKHLYNIQFGTIDAVLIIAANPLPSWQNAFGLRLSTDSDNTCSRDIFYQVLGDQPQCVLSRIFEHLKISAACEHVTFEFPSSNIPEIPIPFRHLEKKKSTFGKALEKIAVVASRRMSRAFSINAKDNDLPRSISVSSQLHKDNMNQSISSKCSNKSRKSIQVDHKFESASSPTGSVCSKSSIKSSTKSKIRTFMFRRSIHSPTSPMITAPNSPNTTVNTTNIDQMSKENNEKVFDNKTHLSK